MTKLPKDTAAKPSLTLVPPSVEVPELPSFLRRVSAPEEIAKLRQEASMANTESGRAAAIKTPKSWSDRPAKGKAAAKAKGQSKIAMVAALLRRKEGTTGAEILKATGWPAVSVPAMAKAASLKLRTDKAQRPFRYYGGETGKAAPEPKPQAKAKSETDKVQPGWTAPKAAKAKAVSSELPKLAKRRKAKPAKAEQATA